MAPILHVTNAFTNVFLLLSCLAKPPSNIQRPEALRVTGLHPPAPHLCLLFDSIHQSGPHPTLSLKQNDAENEKLLTFQICAGCWSPAA